MSILETKNLTFSYPDGDQRRIILNHVSASFEQGKFYTILGASGSGKTTFLSLISALDVPQEGQIFFQNKDIKEIGYEKYRRNHIGIVFQNYNLITYMSALENVLVAMGITENELAADLKGHALRVLESVGIDESKAKRRVTRLSGGEQQRVAIARALSTNVDILIADEPTGNLDAKTSREIVEVLEKLAHEQNKCVIVVTHDQSVSARSDLVLKLNTKTQSFEI